MGNEYIRGRRFKVFAGAVNADNVRDRGLKVPHEGGGEDGDVDVVPVKGKDEQQEGFEADGEAGEVFRVEDDLPFCQDALHHLHNVLHREGPE